MAELYSNCCLYFLDIDGQRMEITIAYSPI